MIAKLHFFTLHSPSLRSVWMMFVLRRAGRGRGGSMWSALTPAPVLGSYLSLALQTQRWHKLWSDIVATLARCCFCFCGLSNLHLHRILLCYWWLHDDSRELVEIFIIQTFKIGFKGFCTERKCYTQIHHPIEMNVGQKSISCTYSNS